MGLGDFDGNGTTDITAPNRDDGDHVVESFDRGQRAFESVRASRSTAGDPITITVSALGTANQTLTGFTGTVHFASSDPLAALPADYTFTPADQGAKAFTITFSTGGTQTISATLLGSNPPISSGDSVAVTLPPLQAPRVFLITTARSPLPPARHCPRGFMSFMPMAPGRRFLTKTQRFPAAEARLAIIGLRLE